MKIIVIGGVAAGPKTASRIKRLSPDAEVTLIERGQFLSYAGCGLPYYVSDTIHERDELRNTAIGVVRDATFFRKCKGFEVRDRTEVVDIDREGQRVLVRGGDEESTEEWLPYDKLVFCTGAASIVPPIVGSHKHGVAVMQRIEDAEEMKCALRERESTRVVIVGGGLIGVEMAEALVEAGAEATVVERMPHILGMLDSEMARVVERHMRTKGVHVLTDAAVDEILGDERVEGVRIEGEVIPCDYVIVAVGVKPRSELAEKAGLTIGPRGGIVVDEQMRTSDPNILAAGDCCETTNLVTGKPAYVPLGSTANKQGRVAAATAVGHDDRFPGVLGSGVCKVFDFTVARTGLSEREARAEGYDVVATIVPGADKPHFMPHADAIFMKLVADRSTRRLLGIQCVGPGEGDKRADVAAVAITAGMTVDRAAQLDLCYAPPYSPAMDNFLTGCNVLRNKLDGLFEGCSSDEVGRMLESGDDFTLLDVRSPAEFHEMHLPESLHIPLGALRGRIQEVPRDRPIVVFCKVSLRGYEAARILQQHEYKDVRVMEGGLCLWRGETTCGA